MGKNPNAANITHGLAQLGGGAKKDGGGGMIKGIENVFKAGIDYGVQQAIGSNQSPDEIEAPIVLQIGEGKGD